MKADIPLEWHMHVGRLVIRKGMDMYDSEIFEICGEYGVKESRRELEKAIARAKEIEAADSEDD